MVLDLRVLATPAPEHLPLPKVPGPLVYSAALEAASRYAGDPLVAIRAAKVAINAAGGGPPAEDLDLERDLVGGLFSTEYHKEGVNAVLGSRRPLFQGR